jgi:tRNA pseudouridine(38-40) synthase
MSFKCRILASVSFENADRFRISKRNGTNDACDAWTAFPVDPTDNCSIETLTITMPRYMLTVAYDGTRFHGFQRQMTNQDVAALSASSSNQWPPKRPHWEASGQKQACHQTIQQIIENAIVRWTDTSVGEIYLLFASRTDKGVHSRGQVIAVNLNVDQSTPLYQIVNSINSRLPCDISIESAELCRNAAFDPRSNVQLKQYTYTIKYRRKTYDADGQLAPSCTVGPHSFRSAMESSCLWLVPWALEDFQMSRICEFLQGSHDFAAFVHKDDRQKRSHVLTLSKMIFETKTVTTAEGEAPVVTGRFVVEAVGFRRSMVRNLVGFCVDVCRGCDDLKNWDWNNLWTATSDAAQKVRSAPASGLCLEYVKHKDEETTTT